MSSWSKELQKLGANLTRASELAVKDESKGLSSILYIVGHPEDIKQP